MSVRFVLRVALVVLCFLLGTAGWSQDLPAIPPSLDPGFWGRANQPYILKVTQTTTSVNGIITPQTHAAVRNVYRDSAGRVREESFYDNGRPNSVSIRDPGKNTNSILQLVTKSAVVVSPLRVVVPPPGRGWAVERLPSRYIDGFPTEGFRFTRTIPAPADGSGVPVTVVEEDWISKQLSVVLQQTIYDPRTGTTTKTVAEFKQVEPDPALFAIDLSGYTVHEVGSTAQPAMPLH